MPLSLHAGGGGGTGPAASPLKLDDTGAGAGANALKSGEHADKNAVFIGGVKQLFVDDSLIESSHALERVMNRPTKLGRRVVRPDAPWERALNVSFDLYSSVLREERGGRNVTRVWYFAVQPGAADESHKNGSEVFGRGSSCR